MQKSPDNLNEEPPIIQVDIFSSGMSKRKKAIIGVLGTILICIASAWAYTSWLMAELSAGDKSSEVDQARDVLGTPPRGSVPEISPSGKQRVSAQTVNVLLIGTDARDGEQYGRSDTIMIVRLDADKQTLSMLSIPRDLEVPVPGFGTTKVNAAYSYGGAPLLIETVRDAFGITIHHFVAVDFQGFRDVIDAIGGIYLPIDQRYFNRNDGTPGTNFSDINLYPGYQLLDGRRSLQWVRFRYGDSDFYRVARQQIMIREIKGQLVARDNIPSLPALLRAAAKASTTDIDSLPVLLRLVRSVLDVPSGNTHRVPLEVHGGMSGGIYYMRATDDQIQTAVEHLMDPLGAIDDDGITAKPPSTQEENSEQLDSNPKPKPKKEVSLIDDPTASRLLGSRDIAMRTCVPTGRPSSVSWAKDYPIRRYQLNGHEAVSLNQTLGSSGKGVVWMFTDWDNPPIINSPDRTNKADGREYDLHIDSGNIRIISWRVGKTRVWLTNTLRNELSNDEMLAMAQSCK